MTLSDKLTTTLRVGDIVNLKDDHKYRVLKIFATSGPIVFKRTDGSTHRSFLRTPAHVCNQCSSNGQPVFSTRPPLSATDDPLAQAILKCCGPDSVEAYHLGRPSCLDDVHWITLPETIKGGLI